MRRYLWLIPVLPLAAAVLTPLFLGKLARRAHWPCLASFAVSLFLAVVVLVDALQNAFDPKVGLPYYTWFKAGNVDVGFSLRADALSAVMLVMALSIGLLIAIYSIGYMHGDPGYRRFFAEISLFLFCMTGLVLANNFVVFYAFWEGMGLCSYLLIGFWYKKPQAAQAARKAFLVTRIGDVGLLLGIALLWAGLHPPGKPALHTLDFEVLFDNVAKLEGPLGVACLLLFCGAIGKSAQFPLHVWLPDAMEGPTPVSALIHAATMVTAGVYLVLRCMPLFSRSGDVLAWIAVVGGTTAFLAALMALAQTDLKRLLAYSTISQLGYLFLALGCATTHELVGSASTAALFHLVSHACFKALLFLGAGSVMHAMGNVIDLRRIGGLRRVLPTTHWTFLCGSLALAGFPLLSGFWSKDEILQTVYRAAEPDSPHAALYHLLFWLAMFTAGLTAYYSMRAYFLTFWGTERIPYEAGQHPHESPRVMRIPLQILAVGAVLLAFFIEVFPFYHGFSSLTQRTPRWGFVEHAAGHAIVPVVAILATVLGMSLAWWLLVRSPDLSNRFANRFDWAFQFARRRFYLDDLYELLFVKPTLIVAGWLRFFDMQVVDHAIDLAAHGPRRFAQAFRPLQNGLVQWYALSMAIGIAVIILALIKFVTG